MPIILGELKSACLEVLSSDPSGPTQGRIWYNTTEGKIKFDDGSGIRALLRNDLKLVIGNSGTAANNTRLNRAGNGLLQILPGNDVTAEGSLSTTLAELSSRLENYLDASKPAFGNAGRLIYVTDLEEIQFDTGLAWTTVGAGISDGANVGGFSEVFKDRSGTDLRFRTIQGSNSSINVTQNTNDIDLKLNVIPIQTVAFTASNTWTVPAGVTWIRVIACGGGGGGGGGGGANISKSGGGGGGGGGASYSVFHPVTPGDLLTITIGAGGSGGAGGATGLKGAVGTQGGTTSLTGTGISLSFPGGGFGGGGGSVGGQDASAGNPSVASAGAAGGATNYDGGGGGASVGIGGAGSTYNTALAGLVGRLGGGGGGGAARAGAVAGTAGGAGGASLFSTSAASGGAGNNQASGGGGGGTGLGVGGNGGAAAAAGTAGSTASANTGGGGGGGGGASSTAGGAGGAGGSGHLTIYYVGL